MLLELKLVPCTSSSRWRFTPLSGGFSAVDTGRRCASNGECPNEAGYSAVTVMKKICFA